VFLALPWTMQDSADPKIKAELLDSKAKRQQEAGRKKQG
jgi:hypothetical protein